MSDDTHARRREFTRRAPELRAALVGELSDCVARASALAADEVAVLRHVLAYGGYGENHGLVIPGLAVLWGEAQSYVPAVRLPAERVRAAVRTLSRRGVLRGVGEDVAVDVEVLRALAGPAEALRGERRVVVYVAASLDGYIAKKDGDVGFLESVAAPPEDYGYAEFLKTIDVVMMGRKTYEKALSFGQGFPHEGRRVFVLSRKRKGSDGRVEFARDPARLIARLRREPGRDIFCDGGAQIVHALLKKDLVDVLVVSLIPTLLGDGLPLFKRGRPERRLRLIDSRAFPAGLVQLRYQRA